MVYFEDSATGHVSYPVHALLLQWLIFASVLIFALWLVWEYRLAQEIIRTDPTGLSLIITAIFFGGTVHCGLRSWFLSSQLNELNAIVSDTAGLRYDGGQLYLGRRPLAPSLVRDYLENVFRRRASGGDGHRDLSRLDGVLAEKASGTHETGWFFTGMLIKLGLLGTVIGFILMLTSVSGSMSFDPSEIHELFSEMTHGMRVALNTTLVGLLGAMLLGFQYLMLDRGADRLMSGTVRFTERLEL